MVHLALEKTNKPQNLLEKREVTETATAAEETKTLGNGAVADDLGTDTPESITQEAEEIKGQEFFLGEEFTEGNLDAPPKIEQEIMDREMSSEILENSDRLFEKATAPRNNETE
jgi:hypothetical protein